MRNAHRIGARNPSWPWMMMQEWCEGPFGEIAVAPDIYETRRNKGTSKRDPSASHFAEARRASMNGLNAEPVRLFALIGLAGSIPHIDRPCRGPRSA